MDGVTMLWQVDGVWAVYFMALIPIIPTILLILAYRYFKLEGLFLRRNSKAVMLEDEVWMKDAMIKAYEQELERRDSRE